MITEKAYMSVEKYVFCKMKLRCCVPTNQGNLIISIKNFDLQKTHIIQHNSALYKARNKMGTIIEFKAIHLIKQRHLYMFVI